MNLTRVSIFVFASLMVGGAGAFIGIRDPIAGRNVSRFIGNAANITKHLGSMEIFKEVKDLWNSAEVNCLIARVAKTQIFGVITPNISLLKDEGNLKKMYAFLKNAKDICESSKTTDRPWVDVK